MIRPLRGYCLIEPIDEQEKSPSGLIMPDSAKDKPQKGMVIAIGDTSARTETLNWTFDDAKVGAKVYYKKWTNESIKVDGKEYLFVEFKDILGIIE